MVQIIAFNEKFDAKGMTLLAQVLSGDSIILRGQPKGGPPPEKTIGLSNIVAPRLGRRATGNSEETKDEPFAWEAREFLRKKLIGKQVNFVLEHKPPSGKEYGYVYLGKGEYNCLIIEGNVLSWLKVMFQVCILVTSC